jgi:hypothetical protein
MHIFTDSRFSLLKRRSNEFSVEIGKQRSKKTKESLSNAIGFSTVSSSGHTNEIILFILFGFGPEAIHSYYSIENFDKSRPDNELVCESIV